MFAVSSTDEFRYEGSYMFTVECVPATKTTGLRDNEALLNRIWPKAHLNENYLRWLYLKNPTGAATIAEARDRRANLIGQAAFIPVDFTSSLGESKQGALCVNLAVTPENRKRGVFAALINSFEASSPLCHFILAIVNQHSFPGFQQKLKFTTTGPLEVRVGFGFPKQMNRLPNASRRDWNDESLKWRLQNPNASYFRCPKSRFLWSQKGVTQIILKRDFPRTSGVTEKQIVQTKPLALIGQSLPMTFSKSVPIPLFMRPSPLYFVFKKLTPDLSFSHWMIDGFDLDSF